MFVHMSIVVDCRFPPSYRSGTFILCTGSYSLVGVGRVLVLVLDNKYLYLRCTGNCW